MFNPSSTALEDTLVNLNDVVEDPWCPLPFAFIDTMAFPSAISSQLRASFHGMIHYSDPFVLHRSIDLKCGSSPSQLKCVVSTLVFLPSTLSMTWVILLTPLCLGHWNYHLQDWAPPPIQDLEGLNRDIVARRTIYRVSLIPPQILDYSRSPSLSIQKTRELSVPVTKATFATSYLTSPYNCHLYQSLLLAHLPQLI